MKQLAVFWCIAGIMIISFLILQEFPIFEMEDMPARKSIGLLLLSYSLGFWVAYQENR